VCCGRKRKKYKYIDERKKEEVAYIAANRAEEGMEDEGEKGNGNGDRGGEKSQETGMYL
jgi:hypothetical protein